MAADADQHQLSPIGEALADRTIVCAYDRAGVGTSTAPRDTPRSLTDVVADLRTFIEAADVRPPYLLVGFSTGGAIAFRYSQTHPDDVAGFVSMNPVPPAETFLALAREVETDDEFEGELAFFGGENEERIDFSETERMLRDPLPADMPYAVMFDEDCGGDTEFCGRILPALRQVTESLAKVGGGGRFVHARDAGHNIFETDLQLVLDTIEAVRDDAARTRTTPDG